MSEPVSIRAGGRTGDIILINGTSSAGKSSIAAELQQLAQVPFLHSGIDHFLHRMPLRVFDDPQWCVMERDADGALSGVTLGPLARTLFCAAYRAIAAIANAGVSVIVDDVLYDAGVVHCMVATFAPFVPLAVGIHCELDVAVAREAARGDRLRGGARTFFARAHRFMTYDLEIDTTAIDARTAAAAILAVRDRPRTAVARLARQMQKLP